MGVKQFGARVTRFEDPALLSGRGRYVDDIAPDGALHACFVRSPMAHAKIRSIDSAAARAMPGVHAVLTAADLPAPMRERIPTLQANPAMKLIRTAALPRRRRGLLRRAGGRGGHRRQPRRSPKMPPRW